MQSEPNGKTEMATAEISKVAVPVTVVGLQQSLYAIDGETGGLDRAVTIVESAAVDALENLAQDASVVVRERQNRLDEIGRALAEVAKAKSWLYAQEKSDTGIVYNEGLNYSYNLQELRGYDFGLKSPTVTRGEIDEVSAKVQHESELMGNRLSQASSSLKDYISKRDKIYTQLEKAIGKINTGVAKTIREMG